MMAGVVAGQARLLAPVSVALWTPLNMAVVPQIYLDAHDSVVTDVSGTCSAISNLGAMGSAGSFSQATAGSRPIILIAELNGKRVLRFDGTDDVLLGATAEQKNLLRNVGVGWSFEVVKKRTLEASGAAGRLVFDCRNGSGGARLGTLVNSAVAGAQNKPAMQAMRLDGGEITTVNFAAAASSTAYEMRLFNMSFATGVGSIYIGGALSSSNAAATSAGVTSDTPSSLPLGLGAYYTGAAPADIDLASIVVGRTALSAGDIDRLFGWAAHKYGLTASLPVGHPYKTVAPAV